MPIPEQTVTLTKVEYDKLKSFEWQLAELKRLVFGTRSERFLTDQDKSQLALFDKAQTPEQADSDPQTITYQRKKKPEEKQHPVRALLPDHLPREEHLIEPDHLEEGMEKIGEQVCETLEYRAGRLYVKRIVRPKYVKQGQDGVHIAALPTRPIPKGNAGAGLLAHLQVSKWVDHLPFHRQLQIFKREGVKMAASTINGWFTATSELLTPLYEQMVDQIKQQSYLQADESSIRVQDKHKQGATHLGYHWVYHAPLQKLVVFDYQPSRSREGPATFLNSFQGHLQTDGYTAYNELGKSNKITLLACMAHARRYFEKALDNDRQAAEHALTLIQSLYAIEQEATEQQLHSVARQQLRRKEALPLLEKWKAWLEYQREVTTPKSPIGKAVNYTLTLWSRLIRYTENGDFNIDNNRIENTIRPLALGRKNYLFAGSHQAAQRAAMMYSFFATCKINQVNPYSWLKQTLEQLPEARINQLEHLMPQNGPKLNL